MPFVLAYSFIIFRLSTEKQTGTVVSPSVAMVFNIYLRYICLSVYDKAGKFLVKFE